MSDSTFITRVILKNYKSILSCDVRLEPLTFLVGPNGSGKSNFLDALHFVADALRTTLDQAIQKRYDLFGLVPRHSKEHWFGIRLEFNLDAKTIGHYAIRISEQSNNTNGYGVETEECVITNKLDSKPIAYFKVKEGKVETNFNGVVIPAAYSNRLYLVAVTGLAVFQPVYDALCGMGFYNFNLPKMRVIDQSETREPLESDGSNFIGVFLDIFYNAANSRQRIEEYLTAITPGLQEIYTSKIQDTKREILLFHQSIGGTQASLFPRDLSDGTLRAFGIFVALFQRSIKNPLKMIGIEEPELAIHPSALAVILDSLREASAYRQVVVTSHSPDLLEYKELDPNSILAVIAEDGITQIGHLDQASTSALRDHLYTGGELLRLNQYAPDLSLTNSSEQSPLFDERIA